MTSAHDAVPPHIDNMAKAIVAGTSKLIQLRRSLTRALVQVGIAKEKTIHCSRILVDLSNRDGFGLDCQRCHTVLTLQAFNGWHCDEFEGVVRDVPPAKQAEVIHFNERLVADAAVGQFPLAPVTGPAEFTALLGNHSTQSHRLVFFEVKHADADLCLDGRLSASAVAKVDSDLAMVCTHGAPYVHIPSWFFEKYPGLDLAMQSAGNVPVQAGEHDWQLHRKVYAAMRQGSNYVQVRAQVMKSMPPNSEAIPFWHAFIERFAGGEGEPALVHTEECIRVFNPPNKLINPKVIDALSQLWKSDKQCETLRHAVIKLWYASDVKFTDADVKKLGNPNSMLSKAVSLDSLLVDMTESVQVKSISDMTLNALVRKQQTIFEMDCVSLLFDKPTQHVKQIEAACVLKSTQLKYTDLALNCVDELEKILGRRVTNKYDKDLAGAVPAGTSTTPAAGTALLAAAAKAKAPATAMQSGEDFSEYIVNEEGFKVGMQIIHRDMAAKKDFKDDFRFIRRMDGGIVTLEDEAGLKYEATVASFQNKAWLKYSAKKTAKIEGWTLHSPCHSTLWADAVIKCMCVKAIYDAYHKSFGQEQLDLTSKPRGCVAIENISKNSVCLVPTTSNISLVDASEDKAGICIGTVNNRRLVLSSMTVQPTAGKKKTAGFFECFWFVTEAEDAKDANCSLSDLSNKKYPFKNDGSDIKFMIPVITLTRDIKAGEFLKLPPVKPKVKKTFADQKCPAGGKRVETDTAEDKDNKDKKVKKARN